MRDSVERSSFTAKALLVQVARRFEASLCKHAEGHAYFSQASARHESLS